MDYFVFNVLIEKFNCARIIIEQRAFKLPQRTQSGGDGSVDLRGYKSKKLTQHYLCCSLCIILFRFDATSEYTLQSGETLFL